MPASLRNLTALALASLLVLTGFAPAAHADEQANEEPTLSTAEDQAEDLAEESEESEEPGAETSLAMEVSPTELAPGDQYQVEGEFTAEGVDITGTEVTFVVGEELDENGNVVGEMLASYPFGLNNGWYRWWRHAPEAWTDHETTYIQAVYEQTEADGVVLPRTYSPVAELNVTEDAEEPIAVDRILSGGGPTRILDGEVFYTNVRLYLVDAEGIEDLPLPDAPIEIYDTNDVNRENLLGSSDDWFLETGAGTPHFRIDNFDMDVALPPGDYRFDFVFSDSAYYEDAERTQGGGYWTVLDPAELTQLSVQAEAADSIFEDDNLDVQVEVTPDMGSNWRGNFTSTEAGIYFADDAEFENPLATHRPVTGRWDQPWEGTLEVPAEDLPLGQHELVVRTHQYAQITVAPAVSEPFTVQVLSAEPEHPAWDSSAVYTGGEIVEYQGQVFEALWWTQNQEPGASPYSAWSEIGAPTECESGTYPAWAASTEFRGGETVVHEGTVYTAKWYSRNQEPGDQWGPWEDSGDC